MSPPCRTLFALSAWITALLLAPPAAPAAPNAGEDLIADAPAAELPAFSDETPSVVGASRVRESLEEAPAAVTVITADDIRRFGWRTITEVLANVRGLYISNDRNYAYLGVRGFAPPGDYNSRVLVVVNGHPMNDATYLASLLGHEFGIDMELVERIEVIRGPGSSLYGTNAVFAVINVVTRTAPDVRHLDGAGVRASLESDSISTSKALFGFDRSFGNGLRVLLSGSYTYGAGESLDLEGLGPDGTMMRTDRERDAMRALNLYASASLGSFSLQAGLNRYRKNVPTASYFTIPGGDLRTVDYRAFVEAKVEVSPFDALDLSFQTYADWAAYQGWYPYEESEGGMFSDRGEGTWAGADAMATWKPVETLRIAAGTSLQRYFDVNEVAIQAGESTSFENHGAYFGAAAFANAELSLWIFSLAGGARLDWMETYGSQLSPRVALITNLLPGSTVKLIFGEAFRAPTHYELFFTGGNSEPNPNLRPETMRHYEAVVEQQVGDGRGLISIGVYHYRIEGMIAAGLNPETNDEVFQNLDQAESTGVELEVSGRLPWLGARGAASYAYSRTIDSATRRRLANSPEHIALARLSLPLHEDNVFLGVASRYLGSRPGFVGRRPAPGAFTLDLTLTFDDVIRGLDLGIGASNLLDQRWTIPGGVDQVVEQIPQDGRRVWLSLSYLF